MAKKTGKRVEEVKEEEPIVEEETDEEDQQSPDTSAVEETVEEEREAVPEPETMQMEQPRMEDNTGLLCGCL